MTIQLVLASGSPRRQALLAALGLTFVVDAADVDETPFRNEAAQEMVMRLSVAKASAVAARHAQAVVLAADTAVVLDGVLLGKPSNPAEAATMLAALRGRTHEVHTAIAVADGRLRIPGDGRVVPGHPRLRTGLSISAVTMRAYTDREIAGYVATGDPLDKAGGYAIQHPWFSPVASWAGCYAGIMGLPLRLAGELLAEVGIHVPGEVVGGVCTGVSGRPCECDVTGAQG